MATEKWRRRSEGKPTEGRSTQTTMRTRVVTNDPARTTWGRVTEGTTAVVVKGVRDQVGELVTVVRKCAVMVRIRYATDGTEGMKRQESLLFLEEGLEVQRDHRGHLWVTRTKCDWGEEGRTTSEGGTDGTVNVVED
jgi:hypothetical protein